MEVNVVQDAQTFESRYDAVIVGARCAGASTALLLARAGLNILLVDRQKYGTDMLSTHALMRAGVLQLKRWGVLSALMAETTPEIKETIFHYGSEAIHIDIKTEHGVEFLCAPRRQVLDRLLVDAAREAGADVRHGVSVTDLQFGSDGRVTGVNLKDTDGNAVAAGSDVVIGADGRQSMVARSVDAQIYVEGTGASGYVYGYYSDLADDVLHWYFEKDTGAGVIPTNDSQHCVFVAVPQEQFASIFRKDLDGGFLRMAAANSPELAEDITKARRVSRLRGFAGSPGYFRQSHGPGWALVGDAGYFKDPLTAHGITDAFVDAELLARAVLDGRAGAFQHYQDERDALSRALFDVTDVIATFDWDLDEVKDHHALLSDAMKAEAAHVANFSALGAVAT
jgi:flavin-dependent dehydrogenase